MAYGRGLSGKVVFRETESFKKGESRFIMGVVTEEDHKFVQMLGFEFRLDEEQEPTVFEVVSDKVEQFDAWRNSGRFTVALPRAELKRRIQEYQWMLDNDLTQEGYEESCTLLYEGEGPQDLREERQPGA